MSSLIWVEKSVTASEVGFATTMITNSFLIYLILNHTKKLFGAYKYLIVAFSTMGLIFATAEFIVKPDEENNIRWRSAMVMGSVSKILFIQYAVMVYCGTRMHFKMGEKLEKLSVKNRKMHQQLFKTLVVQITVPTFIIFMPVMIMFAIPFLDMKINVPTGPVICALSLYPFIDAIIVLCIVSDYRKASSGKLIKLDELLLC
uniref:Uncharacterized protein n=1 Tax=Caenorhabditis japonica TaxID=281687 RepID=A0A8R1DMQ9_CAEJA